MNRLQRTALAAALVLAAAGAARADGAKVLNDAPPGTPAASAAANADPLARFGWLNLGYYGAHYNGRDFGITDGAFGIGVGAALGLTRIAPGFNLDVWANIAGAFGTLDYYPINAGIGFSYDRLPLQLFGGAAFSVVPHTADQFDNSIAVGVDVLAMGIYPLPAVAEHFAAQAQLQFDILNQSLFLWSLTVGIAYSF